MKEAHQVAANGQAPASMQEPRTATALHELDNRRMSPERRAHLSITIAKELSEQHRRELWMEDLADYHFELGEAEGLKKGEEIGELKASKKGHPKPDEKTAYYGYGNR